jgi:predicted nucleic acid-binding protein
VPGRVVLLDTSFILALENKDDPHHGRAKSLDRELLEAQASLLLHWGILLEIGDGFARIERRSKGIDLLAKFEEEEGYVVCPITSRLLDEAVDLYRRRPDKSWGLTDCLSFALMTERQITEALTADVHFRQAGFKALLLEPSS